MRGLGRIQSPSGIAEPPEELVFLQTRSNLDLAAGGGGL